MSLTNNGHEIVVLRCKYTKRQAGARVDDLYVVCGQAIRSGKVADNLDRFFNHLINREKTRLQKYKYRALNVEELRSL
jgi:hypothetical protein